MNLGKTLFNLSFLFLFFGLFSCSTREGSWEPQYSGTTANLTSSSFVNPQKGWVVGEGGTILFTIDGGKTWVSQSSQTQENLFCVDFINERKGWVAGQGMTILSTNDGGKTWSKISQGGEKTILDIHLIHLLSITPINPKEFF